MTVPESITPVRDTSKTMQGSKERKSARSILHTERRDVPTRDLDLLLRHLCSRSPTASRTDAEHIVEVAQGDLATKGTLARRVFLGGDSRSHGVRQHHEAITQLQSRGVSAALDCIRSRTPRLERTRPSSGGDLIARLGVDERDHVFDLIISHGRELYPCVGLLARATLDDGL